MVRSLICAAALLAATPLFAGNICNNHVVAHSAYVEPYVAPIAAVVTPQYITQNIFYSVGDQVRYPIVAPQAVVQAEAGQLQREMQRLQDKMNDLKQYSAYQPQPQVVYVPVPAQPVQQAAPCTTGTCPPKTPPAAQPPAQPQQPASPPAPENPKFSMRQGGVIEAKCIKCHGGSGQPKGDLDLRNAISCEQFHAAIDRLLTDDPDKRMPLKQPPLTGEETAQVEKELLAMKIEEPKGK